MGICYDNFLSGLPARVHVAGFSQCASGLNDYSGFLGKRLWIGRSGNVVAISGAWASGGWLSGDIGQAVGYAVNSGGFLISIVPVTWSGGPFGLPTGFGA